MWKKFRTVKLLQKVFDIVYHVWFKNSHIRKKIKYYRHISSVDAKSYPSSINRDQCRIRGRVWIPKFSSVQTFSLRRKVVSLFLLYRYTQDKCTDELDTFVPVVETLKIMTHHCYAHVIETPNSLSISTARMRLTAFHKETLIYGSDSSVDASSKTNNLITPSLESVLNYLVLIIFMFSFYIQFTHLIQ